MHVCYCPLITRAIAWHCPTARLLLPNSTWAGHYETTSRCGHLRYGLLPAHTNPHFHHLAIDHARGPSFPLAWPMAHLTHLSLLGTLRHRMVGTFLVPSFGYYCWSPKGGQAGRVVKSFNLGLTSWRVAAGPEWSGHGAGGQWGASACCSDSPGYAAFFVPKLDNKKFKQTRCCSVGGHELWCWE